MMDFSPLFPLPWLWTAAAVVLAVTLYGQIRRVRGSLLRGLAGLSLLLAASGPVLYRQDGGTRPLRPVLLLAVDDSVSQQAGDRPAQTAAAIAELERRYANRPDVEMRLVRIGGTEATHLFQGVEKALAEGERERLGGMILITDGRIHDRPGPAWPDVPLHVLLTGQAKERDSRVLLPQQPGYGLVGSTVPLTVTLEDPGSLQPRPLTVRVEGRTFHHSLTVPGQPVSLSLPLTHAGPHWVEVETPPPDGDLNPGNNRRSFAVQGVRDRLHVLLVSGRPHMGERMWRHVLKNDPSLDLVHFTILRQPEQFDPTPQQDMALIPFPVQELFEERLPRFDLVILDRPQRRSLLDPAYFQRLADYVQGGGAVLASVGSDFGGPDGIGHTALSAILPALPDPDGVGTGADGTGIPFVPHRTREGLRHPVTADLPNPDRWGRWRDRASARPTGRGHVLLAADDGEGAAPLLLVDQVGQGRVALLLSSDLWRWGRGVDGGGPQGDLVRRLVHWLLRESELEIPRLTVRQDAGQVQVLYGGLDDTPPPARAVAENGDEQPFALQTGPQPGQFVAHLAAATPQAGPLRQVRVGGLTAPVHHPEDRSEEGRTLLSTDDILAPLVRRSGGRLSRLALGLPGDFSLSPVPSSPGPLRPVAWADCAWWLALAALFSVWSWRQEKN